MKKTYLPKISICIPTYNRANFIKEAIFSALNQSLSSTEILIVDDGSTDHTEQIIKSINSTSIRYVKKQHTGAPDTRNRCINESLGELILWLDSDDILLPHTLKHYADIIQKDNRIDVVYGDLEIFGKQNSLLTYRDYYNNNNLLIYKIITENPIPNPGTLVRKKIYELHGNYDTSFTRAHDYEFWVRISDKAIFKHAGIVAARWRIHSKNLGAGNNNLDTSYESHVIQKILKKYSIHQIFSLTKFEDENEFILNALKIIILQFYRWKDYEKTIEYCKIFLKNKKSIEILYILSSSQIYLNKINEALDSLNKVLLIDPNDNNAKNIINKLKDQQINTTFINKEFNQYKIMTKQKKVLIIGTWFWPSVGGQETALLEISRVLVDLDFEVHIGTKHMKERESHSFQNIIIHEFTEFNNMTRGINGGIDDLEHLIYNHKFSHLIILNTPAPWPQHICKISKPRPIIIYFPIINYDCVQRYLIEGTLPSIMKEISQADIVGTISESSCEAQLLTTAGIPHLFIPHGIPQIKDAPEIRHQLGLPSDIPLFVMVANHWPIKNHLGLINTMKNLRGNWRLLLIGNPAPGHESHHEDIRLAVSDDSRFSLHSNLPRSLVESAISSADILLLASHGEGSPMVIFEAMSCGTPWLATPTCGSVRDQAGGIIAPLPAFPRIITELMKMKNERKALGLLGKKHWKMCFSTQKLKETFYYLLNDIEKAPDLRMPKELRTDNSIVQHKILSNLI